MILDAVKHQKRVAWLLLSNASVDTLQDGVLTLRFTREGEAKGFSGSGYDQELGRVLQNMLGISPRVRAVASAAGGGGGSSWVAGPDLPPDEDEPGDPGGPGGGPGGYGGSGGRAPATASASTPGRDGGVSGRGGSGAAGRAGSGGGAPGRAAAGGGTGSGAAGNSEALTGMDLITSTLGGEVIDETGDA